MKNSMRWTKITTTLTLSFLLSGFLQAQSVNKTIGGNAPSVAGAKKRISVSAFAGDSFGISDFLTAELVKTGRFIVVERAQMEGVNQEQALGTSSQTTAETAVPGGQLLGAQLVLTGNVTQASETEHKGLNVGVGGFGRFFDNAGATVDGTSTKVLLDVRLLDATTGQVLYSFHAQGKANGHETSLQLQKNLLNAGGQRVHQKPLDETLQKPIRQAVTQIIQKIQDAAGEEQDADAGQVIDVIDGQIYINYGADSGIHAGDTLAVSTVVEQLVDPNTGLQLGNAERPIGELRVQTVNGKYSIAVPVGHLQTKRGDLVRIKSRA